MGTVIITRRLANGETLCVLLLGVKYGSLGLTITLFAVIVGGGKLYVFHTFGLARAVAIEALSVVMAAVTIPPLSRDLCNRL